MNHPSQQLQTPTPPGTVAADKGKKQRRKHKNSKLGCLQCKQRRMKCNEELPECRNCRIRQVKIPCSYVSFTEEEKKEFIATKAKQDSQTKSTLPSPTSSSPIPITDDKPVTLKLVKHVQLDTFQSQQFKFVQETDSAYHGRLFFLKMVNSTFFKFDESFESHFTFVLCWLRIQMQKRIEAYGMEDDEQSQRRLEMLDKLALKHKSQTIAYLRTWVLKLIKAQEEGDFKKSLYYFSKFTIPTICLQSCDMLMADTLRGYFISGSLVALTDLYDHTAETSPVASFIGSSAFVTQKGLFFQSYPCDVLEEILDVLKEMESFIQETNDEVLIWHYDALVDFFEEDLDTEMLRSKLNLKSVTSYPAMLIYQITHKFYKITPSEMHTIDTCASPVHKVFYSFYYMIARCLDNIFPETRFLTRFRFIGPTTIYPFRIQDLYDGISPELRYYASYSCRLLAFFTRRADLFGKYMKIMTPFPESLAENRFKSRKHKVKEECVSRFRTTLLTPNNYPQVFDTPATNTTTTHNDYNSNNNSEDNSPSSQASFSIQFNTQYPLSFQLNNALSLDQQSGFPLGNGNGNGNVIPDLSNVSESGLLVNDYDPLKEEPTELPLNEPTSISLRAYVEDYGALMKEFIR